MTGLIPHKGVITKEGMMPLLVEASPGFSSQWIEFQAEWKDDKEGLPYYLCLGNFARYLGEKLQQGDTADFPAIFHTVGRLHLEGDAYVREAATVGLLEGIQNLHGEAATKFVSYLQPETKRWWDKLNDFWEKGKLLTNDQQKRV
jgi:hypothetical protein